ncbi:hypothetical protein Ancab_022171 [Ancistrocladus abbreviatus]
MEEMNEEEMIHCIEEIEERDAVLYEGNVQKAGNGIDEVDEDEFPIHLTEEPPSDISWVDWGANKGVPIDSSDVGSHSLASLSVVPESAGNDVICENLPTIVPSPVDIPKVQNLF